METAEVHSQPDQQDLVHRAQRGDAVALTVLLAQGHPRIRAFIADRIPDDLRARVDADDILQEAQMDVFRHASRFEPRGEGSFHRWVAAIALRKLRNAVRTQRALKRGGAQPRAAGGVTDQGSLLAFLDILAGPMETPSHRVATGEAIHALEGAIAELPAQYREAVRLVYLEGCAVDDAARALGRTPRAVHNLCHKAKVRLRAALGSSTRFFSRF